MRRLLEEDVQECTVCVNKIVDTGIQICNPKVCQFVSIVTRNELRVIRPIWCKGAKLICQSIEYIALVVRLPPHNDILVMTHYHALQQSRPRSPSG